MLAQQDTIFAETGETIFQQNQDDAVRYWCEALEEGERTARTIEYLRKKELEEKDAALAEKDSALAKKDSALAEKDATLAEKDSIIAKQKMENERLLAELQKYKALYDK